MHLLNDNIRTVVNLIPEPSGVTFDPLLIHFGSSIENIFHSVEEMTSRYKAAAPVSLRPIQMGCVTRSRIGQFNTHVKGGQLENSLSYCILRSKLCKSEQGNNMTSRKIILYVQYTYHYKYHDAICQDVRITVFSNAKTLKCDLSCAKMSHNLGCLS